MDAYGEAAQAPQKVTVIPTMNSSDEFRVSGAPALAPRAPRPAHRRRSLGRWTGLQKLGSRGERRRRTPAVSRGCLSLHEAPVVGMMQPEHEDDSAELP